MTTMFLMMTVFVCTSGGCGAMILNKVYPSDPKWHSRAVGGFIGVIVAVVICFAGLQPT
jgi:hypothetical protein